MSSPEEVMKRVREELGFEEEEVMEQSTAKKAKRGSRSSTTSGESLVFSPILVKQGGEIVNVSTTSTSSNSVTEELPAERLVTSPVFSFDREAFRGHIDWSMIVGTRSDTLPLYRSSLDEMRRTTNYYLDDATMIRRRMSDIGGEEEVKDESDDVFHMSQID